MSQRIWSALVSLLMIAYVLAGCSTGAPPAERAAPSKVEPAPKSKQTVYPVTLKDSAGREVTLPTEPKRIISMAPSNTELVFALGKGGALVGRSDFCDYPAEARAIESIGGILKPNFEKIVSLKPDLVLFIGGSAEVRDQLAKTYNLNLFVVDPQNFAALYETIHSLGLALNTQEQAAKLTEEMQKAVREVSDIVAKANAKPKVFYEVWDNPLMTAGAGTFVDDLIKLAGGLNVGADVQGWVEYSVEKLQAHDPDVIVVSSQQNVGKVKERKGWEGFKAVKQSRIMAVEDENLVVRPGPRLVLGLKWFARTLHPDLFR